MSVDTLEVARTLGLPLHAVEELCVGSAISPEVLKRARVTYVSDPKAASKRFGQKPQAWAEGRLPAWVVPYHLPFHDDPVLERVKPRKPFERKDRTTGKVTLRKYMQPHGSGTHLYFGPSLLEGDARENVARPLVITEGEKKALAAESAGFAAIAIPGVNQWHVKGDKRLHPYFAHVTLKGRTVYLCFDRDSLSNAGVRKEEIALGRILEGHGASVAVVRFPADAPKLDDYLATHEVTEFAQLLEHALERGRLPEDTQGVKGAPAPATATTDLGNAERFVRDHGDDLRYCEVMGAWFVWTGARWERDSTSVVMRRAARTVRGIYGEADQLPDEESRHAMRQHARNSESQARMKACVGVASTLLRVQVRPEQLDADPWLISFDNGTVDLRTGKLRAHAREDLITKVAPTRFDLEAQHPDWDRFIDESTDGDHEYASYLQRALGYSITGDTREDRFFFVWGPGGCGKGTFVSAVMGAFGEYARTADVASFAATKDRGGEKPRPDLVRLLGSRIVICDEVNQDTRLDEGLMKRVTGGSPVSMRTLQKETFEVRCTYKPWIVANDPPVVRAEDSGIWRRVVRLPFVHHPRVKDRTLRERIGSDPALRAAVAAWAVRGVALWLEAGLVEPRAVRESTAAYRAEMDPVGEFFASHCVFDPEAKCARKELRTAYEQWCKDEGHIPQGARRFAARLRDWLREEKVIDGDPGCNIQVWDGSATRWANGWRGVRLMTDPERSGQMSWGARPVVHRSAEDDEALGTLGALGTSEAVFTPSQFERDHDSVSAGCEQLPSTQSTQSTQEVSKRPESAENQAGYLLGTLGSSEAEKGTSQPDPNSNAESGADQDGEPDEVAEWA